MITDDTDNAAGALLAHVNRGSVEAIMATVFILTRITVVTFQCAHFSR